MGRLDNFFRLSILKSFWVNLRCLPFKYAIKFPILLAWSVRISHLRKGAIQFSDLRDLRFGLLQFGFQDIDGLYSKKSVIDIRGTLIIKGKGFHSFAPGLSLSINKGAVVVIDEFFSCSHNAKFSIFKSLIIGKDNMWSYDNIVMDSDVHKIFYNKGEEISKNRGIVFGNHVWLGCRNIVLKGVSIPDGCIIGAGGVLTKSQKKENAIYVSNKLIKDGISWSRDLNYD